MNKENTTAQNKSSNHWIEFLEYFEKLAFYASLLLLPISVIPLPWDVTEFSMGLVLMLFSSILLTIELIKLVVKGRLLIPKASIDIALLLLILSIVFSTIFSTSIPSSLWGFDFRLGSGAVTILLSIVYLYCVRSFIFTYKEVLIGLQFLIIGTFISSIFSIFSFFGMNILSFWDSFNTLFTTGLPLYSSSRISLVLWGVSLIGSVFLSIFSIKERKISIGFFAILSTVVHLFAIFLYSLTQGWMIFLLLLILLLTFFFYIGLKGKITSGNSFVITLYTILATIIVVFILSLIPFIKTGVGQVSNNLVTQIAISSDTSLKIVTQTLSENVLRTIFGAGHDTFSISYNQYRPLNEESLIINSTNFTNANNQMYNILANRGLLGLSIWLFVGYILLKYVYENVKINTLSKESEIAVLLFDTISILLFLSSIFVYHTFLITFLFIYSISMSVVLRNMIFKDKLDVYVINWGVFTHTSGNIGVKNSTIALIVLLVSIGIFANISVLRLGLSTYHVLKSETIIAKFRNVSDSSDQQKVEAIINSANSYSKAIGYNKNNDVLHRRAAMIVSQYLEILAQKYNKEENEQAKKELFEQIAIYVEISVEEAKKATELAPKVYANWATRSNVYSKLVGLGLTSYTKSALTSIQNGAQLNPLNYESYYNAAQLYILNNESDSALRTLNQLFSINPKHIPSLILAGEISFKDKDYKQAQRYFTDAKQVMEESNSTTGDIYDYVNKKVEEINNLVKPEQETKPTTQEDTNEVQK